jgi:hypothetical protein
MCNECSTTGRFLKNIELMKDFEDYNNEEYSPRRVPNDGLEEIDIEPLDWDDM